MNSRANEKWCPKCKTYLDIKMFGINRTRADGLQSWCAECTSKNSKKTAADNKKKWAGRDPHKENSK